MASCLYISLYFVVGALFLAGQVNALATSSDYHEIVMEEEELLGLYEVLGSLIEDKEWAQMHPLPCTDTPWPGVQCEISEVEAEQEETPVFHVTKIHIGPDIINPPCKSSASLSPTSLHKLPYLRTLSLFNCFVASPVLLSAALFGFNFSSLEHLSLQSNPSLLGDLPSGLSELTSLRVLSLSQNNLKGEIPSGFGRLVNLEQLDLSYNNLSGGIPQELGDLKSLTILDLSWNNIEGQVPSSLGQLQLLQKLDLGFNRISGRLPQELGGLNRLVLLDVSHNSLSGPISSTLSGLENLESLILDHNPLNSGIPQFLGTLESLKSISLSQCRIIGSIPNSLSSLKNLNALYLDNNSLTGTVPSSLGSLTNLDQLNLSNNLLSGELVLPQEFIDRLGKRFDVRGNIGLCTRNNESYNRNVSLYFNTPTCKEQTTATTSIGNKKTCSGDGDNINSICPEENNTLKSNAMQQPYSSSNRKIKTFFLFLYFLFFPS